MIRLGVLGPTTAELNGMPVDLGGPLQRAVLALLVTGRGHAVSVDRMIDSLWQGQPPPSATASLQAYICNLRKALEPDRPRRAAARVLVSAPPGYALRLPVEAVDAWRFEAALQRSRTLRPKQARELLDRALGWWQGPPLAEAAGQQWAEAEIARLTELGLLAREAAIAATLHAGLAGETVPRAEAYARENPLREEGWRLLALAHWARGSRGDALAVLRRARAILATDLGLDPGHALAELEQAIVDRREDVLYAEVPRDGADTPTEAVSAVLVPDASSADREDARPFVGRDAELRAVDDAALAARSRGGVVLVTGEAGAGKSELLARIAPRLRTTGWTVLLGRCPEFDGAPPAWAWVEVLRALEERTVPTDHTALGPLLDPEAASAPRDAVAERFRLHQAVREWLRAAAAERPLAIVIDDLHRADFESLALLVTAAELDGLPLLVVVAYRPSDAGDRLSETLASIAARSPLRLALGGLPAAAVDVVVRAVCGGEVDRRTVANLGERTGGNPFYVWECARLMAGEGALVAAERVPEGVRDVLRRRLKRLPADAVAALRLAAMFGREAEVDLIIEVADATENAVLDGLEAAVIAGLLAEPSPGRVRFEHAIVRDTLYADLVQLRRARLHLRVARTLERLRPQEPTGIAHHYARAMSPVSALPAVEYSVRAADLATRRYAHDTAAHLLEQAVEALGRVPGTPGEHDERMVALLGRLLRAYARAGAITDARGAGQRAVNVARRACRDDLLLTAHTAWTEPTPWPMRPYIGARDTQIADTLERLLEDGRIDPATRCRLLHALIRELSQYGEPRAALAAEELLRVARTVHDPPLPAAALVDVATLPPHELNSGRRAATAELRTLAHAHGLTAYQWFCEYTDCMSAAVDGDPASARRHAEAGLVLARRYRLAEAEAATLTALGLLAHIQGCFAEAEALYEEAVELLTRLGSPHAWPIWICTKITLRNSQGRYAEMESPAREFYARLGARHGHVLALVLARQRRFAEVREIDYRRPIIRDSSYGTNLSVHAELAVLTRDRDYAEELIELLLPMREQFAGAASLVFALRPAAQSLGELYRMLGNETEAMRHFRLAEEVALRWNSPHCLAEARKALADGG